MSDKIIPMRPRKKVPTEEGRRRWPPDGYHPAGSTGGPLSSSFPCSCHSSCHRLCGGQCGCDACGLDFSIFCDDMCWSTENGILVSEAFALEVYRGEKGPGDEPTE